jgi:hypothetical protein
MRYLFACILLLCPFAAAAQSAATASLSECERIKNDLAYNQCLASFGPKQGERPVRAAADADDDEPTAGVPGRRGAVVRRGGRQAAAFDVVSGRDGAARPARATPERR